MPGYLNLQVEQWAVHLFRQQGLYEFIKLKLDLEKSEVWAGLRGGGGMGATVTLYEFHVFIK